MFKSILLVDDEQDILEPMRILLEDQYTVLIALSGQEALDLLEHNRVDMIITDQRMPGMTGVDLLSEVFEIRPEIVRVLVTGYSDIDVTIRAVNEGRVYRYLNKPLDFDEMHQVIRQGLEWQELINTRGQLNAELATAHKAMAERNKELKSLQDELVENAHRSGMAEMASVVLHNVSNLLNSVIVSGQTIVRMTRSSSMAHLSRANSILRENMENIADFIAHDPRGKKLLNYYLALEPILQKENEALSEDSKRLLELIETTVQIIVTQQSYATGGLNAERLELADVIEDVLTIQSHGLSQRGIEVVRDFDPALKVNVLKAKLIHILINLLKNAQEAMDETPRESRQIKVSITSADGGVQMTIHDTGTGIAPEDLPKLFTHGFTTKTDGHGFGLESCAQYMNEMGGTIRAESPGIDQGASFVLNFPA